MSSTTMLIIVMGVSGTGKSTLAKALSEAFNVPFVDGDDLHPKENIEKMSRGVPLGDEDRMPWLRVVRDTGVRLGGSGVIACSALKRDYRRVLRGGDGDAGLDSRTCFVWIKGNKEVLKERMEKRQGHFMKARMLDSQFEALESPEGEKDVVVVPLDASPAEQLRIAREGLIVLQRTTG